MLTCSTDITVDLLLPHFKGNTIRVDLDALPESDMVLHADGFRLCGRDYSLNDFTAVYWRKPSEPLFEFEHVDQLQEFECLQRLYVLRAISRLMMLNRTWQLIDPLHELHYPKPLQLVVARNYFAIPPWGVFTGPSRPSWRPVVAKAMAPAPVKDGRYLATRRIDDPSALSPSFTWFLQKEIHAEYDVTVVFCCGKMWAFKLARAPGERNVDWRLVPDNHLDTSWQRAELPADMHRNIDAYMHVLGMQYARLDFLVDKDNTWWFLESNFNGQFGWLDPGNSHGMLSHVAACAELMPATT